MRKLVVALAALALALSGCGGSHHRRAGDVSPDASSASASPDVGFGQTGSASPGAPTDPAAAQGNNPSQSNPVTLPPETQDHVPGTDKAPLEGRVGQTCLVRGTVQSVSIRSTPGFQLSWGTVYSDGHVHQEWGGQGLGVIPPNGEYTSAWHVPLSAPLGTARTDFAVGGHVNGRDQTAFAHAYWKIQTSC